SCAAANASSTVSTPSCAPSGAITRMGLMRICRLTRTRGALLFGLSIARCCSPPQARKKRTPAAPEPAYPHPRSRSRSEEHTSELQSRSDLVCRLLLEKKKHQLPKHGSPASEP